MGDQAADVDATARLDGGELGDRADAGAAEVVTQVLVDFLADETTPAPPVPAAPPQSARQATGPLDPPPDVVPAEGMATPADRR